MGQDVVARNRARFPQSARFLDEMRSVFGPDVKMTWASENGDEIGRVDQPAGASVCVRDMVLSRPELPAGKARK